MKNRIGHCSYCGAEHVNQYVEHILPLSLSGTNSDDNLIMICADCHRKLDSRSFTEIEFNHYLSQLMQATTKFVDIKLEEKISQDAPYRADITAKDKSGKSWLIECKRAQSFIPVNFNKAVQQVETYKKVSSFDNYVLAFPGLISESQKDNLKRHNIMWWDADVIANEFKKEIKVNQHPVFSRIFLSISKEKKHNAEEELLDKLKNCERGKDGWSDYQKLIGQIFEHLFTPPLGAPISESPDMNNVNRRDWIIPNYCSEGFWNFVRDKYKADYIVVDAKNYKNPISKEQVLQIANYLKPHGAGMFALIATRLGANKGADLTIREQWMANGKMILVLNDDDFEAMLLAKAAKGQPEKIIGQALERFRLSM